MTLFSLFLVLFILAPTPTSMSSKAISKLAPEENYDNSFNLGGKFEKLKSTIWEIEGEF